MAPGEKTGEYRHIPVLLEEVLHLLDPRPGDIVVDATLGGGGHAEAILQRITPGGILLGLDLDQAAIEAAQKRLQRFGEAFLARQGNYANLPAVLAERNLQGVNGILMDLGVSSHQLDCAERGFSYQKDAFLDMRMDPGRGKTAADLLQGLSREELARIFARYGEEKWAGRIASFLERHRRQKEPVTHSAQLVEIIKAAVPASSRRRGGHPARRVFQALRIAVNRELDNLRQGLQAGIACLEPGGRLLVIAYHSLEDEIVKKYFRALAHPCSCPPKFPVCRCGNLPEVRPLTPRAIVPGREEIISNPRARSARLRAAEKLNRKQERNKLRGR